MHPDRRIFVVRQKSERASEKYAMKSTSTMGRRRCPLPTYGGCVVDDDDDDDNMPMAIDD